MDDMFDDETQPMISDDVDPIPDEIEEQTLDLLMGGDEGKECTYNKGYMKRQAIFSCLTCTPEGNAGICLACALSCHDENDHQLVALMTKRNFRCDCGNSKFEKSYCKLQDNKDIENEENLYDHNFEGSFCLCEHDSEDVIKDKMIQCCVCEDWFHEEHLGLESTNQIPKDEAGKPLYEDFICETCSVDFSFLSLYPSTIWATSIIKGKNDKNTLVEKGTLLEGEGSSGKCFFGKDLLSEVAEKNENNEKSKALFLSKNWREILCKCEKCREFYSVNEISFLLEKEDLVSEYMKMAKQKRKEIIEKKMEDYEAKLFNNLDHAAKLEFLSNVADLKNAMEEFCENIDPSKRYTVADVQEFFGKRVKNRRH